MQEQENHDRYSKLFWNAPQKEKSRKYLYEENYDYSKQNYDNQYVPMYDGHYEQAYIPVYEKDNQVCGPRPVGSRYPTLNDMHDYTYNHRGIVGTQNLGMAPMFNPTRSKNRQNDTTYYPDTLYFKEHIKKNKLEDNFRFG
jgi:hypothetical protein